MKEDLDEQAKNQSLAMLEVKYEAEKQISARLEGVLAGLVRNQEWRKTVHGFENTLNSNPDGTYTEDKQPSDTSKEAV